MKICEINEDSETSNFLQISDVSSLAGKLDKLIQEGKEQVCDLLQQQIQGGGLDEYSLTIAGDIRGNIKAKEIYVNVESKLYGLRGISSKILSNAKAHREEEYSVYIDKLKKKIEELNTEAESFSHKILELASLLSLPLAIQNPGTTILHAKLSGQLESVHNKINYYNAKLKAATLEQGEGQMV